MNCCYAQTERKPRRGWWRASGCLGSGALLVLLPKCPLCIAAYVALFTGASAALPVAARVRPFLEILFAASLVLLLVRWVRARRRCEAGNANDPDQQPLCKGPVPAA